VAWSPPPAAAQNGIITGYQVTYENLCAESGKETELMYEGWNFNSGNYLFTTDTK